MSNIKIQGNSNGAGTTTLQSANTSATTTFTLPGTDGTSLQFLQTDGSGNLNFATAAIPGISNTFTAAQTFRAANAVRSEAASTQDAVVIAGRSGGTNSYAVTMTPATLSSNTTLTLPNVNDTVATIGTPQTFTAAQTFQSANAIRSEITSTQDAIIISGRAGGSNSYAVTVQPDTLTNNQTITLPNNTGTVLTTGATVTVAQGGTGVSNLTSNNVLIGNGTDPVQFIAPSTLGNVLTSNGTTWVSQAPSAGGQPFVAFGTTGGF